MDIDILNVRRSAVILDASMRFAGVSVLPSLHVRFKSPNALWRLPSVYQKAVLEGRRSEGEDFKPNFSVIRRYR
jgi:hypothetical protein